MCTFLPVLQFCGFVCDMYIVTVCMCVHVCTWVNSPMCTKIATKRGH